MKYLKSILLFCLLSVSLVFISCDPPRDPVITENTFTDPTSPDFPKRLDGTDYPAGTKIEYTKVEEDDKTTIDEIITYADGTTAVVHSEGLMNDNGDIKETSTETTTFIANEPSGKVKEEITKVEDDTDRSKGHVTTTTVETEYTDGHKVKITDHNEPLTGITTKETLITNKDGSTVETKDKTEDSRIDSNTIEKDSSGNITKKIVKIEFTNWAEKAASAMPWCSEKTYSYVNGTETLVKDYSWDNDDDSNTIETTIENGKTTIETTSSYKDCYEKKVDNVVQETEFFIRGEDIVVKVDFIKGKANYKIVNGATVTFNTGYNYPSGDYIIKFDDEAAPTKISVGKDSGNLTDYAVDTSVIIDESKLHVQINE